MEVVGNSVGALDREGIYNLPSLDRAHAQRTHRNAEVKVGKLCCSLGNMRPSGRYSLRPWFSWNRKGASCSTHITRKQNEASQGQRHCDAARKHWRDCGPGCVALMTLEEELVAHVVHDYVLKQVRRFRALGFRD